MKHLLLLAMLAACGNQLEAAPERPVKLVPITDTLCVTKGSAKIGAAVVEPTMRAVALGTRGNAAALDWIYKGDTVDTRELASGSARRQVGLKLRAQNGCNLIYVMWRLDPKPQIEVSVKLNSGKATHAECGADGYMKVRPTKSWKPPVLASGDRHTLRAAIARDDLTAWVDEKVVWRGKLPAAARTLTGPAGIRSDNLAFELVGLAAPPVEGGETSCRNVAGD
ncbi:MAG: hypothetical protein H0T46_12645 [Deltaproteobacteria bacterium]|nr:hypothetical protein [Deltaproteobacteria bacterium]